MRVKNFPKLPRENVGSCDSSEWYFMFLNRNSGLYIRITFCLSVKSNVWINVCWEVYLVLNTLLKNHVICWTQV